MEENPRLYDKTGREIMRGDILKVFHFIGARRKRYYMYKQVLGVVMLGKDAPAPYLEISHLDLRGSHYHERMDGRVLPDYEIIYGIASGFPEDRPRLAPGANSSCS